MLAASTPYGRVVCVHATPAREDEASFRSLFDACDILMGDLNTTWRTVRRRLPSVASRFESASMPSYLPSRDLDEEDWPPCFDHVCVRRGWGTVRPSDTQHMKLPKVRLRPRDVMRQRRWPSDHVPVEAVVTTACSQIRCATFNVADPAYVGRYHPLATDGFDDTEYVRARRILNVVRRLAHRNDVVALQEVPKAVANVLCLSSLTWLQGWIVQASEHPMPLDEDGRDASRLLILSRGAASRA